MLLADVLKQATELLSPSDTARLDAELLMAQVLQVPRTYLFTHAARELTGAEQQTYQQNIARRKQGEPIAYIVGFKEFWSLAFTVTPAVLIPRPETELLVELVLQFFPEQQPVRRVADLGTGSGAVAIALARERQAWEIYASDQAPEALVLAAQNAQRLGALSSIHFCLGSWCEALPVTGFDVIVSNPPYLSLPEWQLAPPELHFEPMAALLSGADGLHDLRELVHSAKNYLLPGGYLLLEHGNKQAATVRAFLQEAGYIDVSSYGDLAGIERVTKGLVL